MIQKFIKDNNITFNDGERNSSCTILIGYTQHLGLNKNDLKAALDSYIKVDSFISKEIDRLFDYCKAKNYKSYWNKKEAKSLYIF